MRELLDAGNRGQDGRRRELTGRRDAALTAKERLDEREARCASLPPGCEPWECE